MNDTLTPAQSRMLEDIRNGIEIRYNRNQDLVVNGKRATGAQSRVISALQEKRLLKWERIEVSVTGMHRTITRYVLKAK